MAPFITLYLRKSCVSCRIVWLYILKHKIRYKIVDIDQNRPHGFSSMSPMGSVPLLADGDVTVNGSLAIVLYLAEKYTSFGELGITVEQRSKVESVLCWASSALLRDVEHNYVNPNLLREEDTLPAGANSSLIAYGKTEVIFHLNTLENCYLSKTKYLCGNRPSFADRWVTVVLSLLELLSFDFSPWPKVKALMEEMKGNCEYVDISHAHEENVRKCCYGLSGSVGDMRLMTN